MVADLATTPAKPKRNYTGEILHRTRPKTYYRVIHLLAQETPVSVIMRICKVSSQVIDAILRTQK